MEQERPIREVLLWFTELMNNKLQQRHHKGCWRKVLPSDLYVGLFEEIAEFDNEYLKENIHYTNTIMELVDIANYCMMLADRLKMDFLDKKNKTLDI